MNSEVVSVAVSGEHVALASASGIVQAEICEVPDGKIRQILTFLSPFLHI